MNYKYLQKKAPPHHGHYCTQCMHVLPLRAPEPPSPKGKLQWGARPPASSENMHGNMTSGLPTGSHIHIQTYKGKTSKMYDNSSKAYEVKLQSSCQTYM
jgi:hypothetical protein